jgi:AcrR family transcriptional regulator
MADLVAALGLASARIYAAFGSKEALFREAVQIYESQEGGFADRALAEEPTAYQAIERMLLEAVTLYTQRRGRLGCMVVSAATNCASENEQIRQWLAEHRRARTVSIVKRLRQAARDGELKHGTDTQALGDLCASFLHGLSVQARDGIARDRLLATIPPLMSLVGDRS